MRLTETHTQTNKRMHSTNTNQDKQTPLVVLKTMCQTNLTPCPSNPHLATSKLSSELSVDTSYAHIYTNLIPSKPRNLQPPYRLFFTDFGGKIT